MNHRDRPASDVHPANGRGTALEVESSITLADRMPKVWEQLRTLFECYVREFNLQNEPHNALCCEVMSAHLFVIRPDMLPEIITANYQPSTCSIGIRANGITETYRLARVKASNTDFALVNSRN